MATHRARFTDLGDSPLDDDLLGGDAGSIASRKYTVAGTGVITRGEVVTVTGSSVAPAASAAAANGIAAEDADASDSPPDMTEVNVYIQGRFNEHALTLNSVVLADLRPVFRGLGIILETPVRRYPDA
jgi:hypothetical protein